MKKCIACGKRKAIDKFYAHPQMGDGHLNKCKECCKLHAVENRKRNIDYYREYDKARTNLPHRAKARKESSKRWVERNILGRAAQIIIGNKIRNGTLERPENCSSCGVVCKPHAHHDDYEKPLEVRWLCVSCHATWHRHNPKVGN